VKSSVNDVPQFLGFPVFVEIVVEALAGIAVPMLPESPFKVEQVGTAAQAM
jgi:hypothetical protein